MFELILKRGKGINMNGTKSNLWMPLIELETEPQWWILDINTLVIVMGIIIIHILIIGIIILILKKRRDKHESE